MARASRDGCIRSGHGGSADVGGGGLVETLILSGVPAISVDGQLTTHTGQPNLAKLLAAV